MTRGGYARRNGERRDRMAYDGSGSDDRVAADGHTVGDHAVRTEPDVVVHLDPLGDPVLMEHRRVGAVVGMVSTDQVHVCRNQGVLAEADTTAGEDLAVEADARVVVDLDVSILAAQNGAPPDEDTGSDVDATVVGTLRVQAAPVVDYYVVPDTNLVGVSEHHVGAERDIAAGAAEQQRVQLRA